LPEVVPEAGQEHTDASAEFADGLAGESESEDLLRRYVPVGDQPHHSLRDDSGLAGTGTGGDLHRLLRIGFDDDLLFRAGRESLCGVGGCQPRELFGGEAHQFSSSIFGPIAGQDDRTGQLWHFCGSTRAGKPAARILPETSSMSSRAQPGSESTSRAGCSLTVRDDLRRKTSSAP